MMALWVLLLYPSMSDVSPALLPMDNFGLPNDESSLEISRGLFEKPVTE